MTKFDVYLRALAMTVALCIPMIVSMPTAALPKVDTGLPPAL